MRWFGKGVGALEAERQITVNECDRIVWVESTLNYYNQASFTWGADNLQLTLEGGVHLGIADMSVTEHDHAFVMEGRRQSPNAD